MGATPEGITVLHVDDDPDFVAMAAEFLENESGELTVHTETGVEAALARLDEEPVDCVVSDFDMPHLDGIEFLETVRETAPDLPFILFTGKGSEEVASEAISAGVSDYLQKESGSGPFAVLANRIENAVSKHRAEAELSTVQQRYELVSEVATDAFFDWEVGTRSVDRSEGFYEAFGYEDPEPDDEMGWYVERIHPEDRETVWDIPEQAMAAGEQRFEDVHRFQRADETYAHLDVRGRIVYDDGEPVRIIGALSDVTERKRKERELRETTRRFDLALEATDSGLWEWDMATDEVTWDENLEALLGIEPGGFGGTYEAHAEYLHPDDVAIVEAGIEAAVEGDGEFHEEFRMVREDGDVIWIEGHGQITTAGDHRWMVGLATDVTGRKRREREIARVRDRMAFALETTGAVVFELDLETMTETRHGPFGVLYGVPEADVVELDAFYELAVHPDDRATIQEHQRAVVEGGSDSTEVEYRTHPDAGPVRWVRSQMARVSGDRPTDGDSVVGLAVDVTAQKERERALADSEERYRRLVAIAPSPIFVYSTDGVLIYANEAAVDFLGAEDRSEVVGLTVEDIAHPDEWPTLEARERRLLEEDEPAPPVERKLRTLDGEVRHAIVAAATVTYEGEPAVQTVTTDITAVKEREAELERQVERLDEFASIVSHDLRNPLGVARGRLELAREDLEHEDLERAGVALERMAGLIDDLLALARYGDAVQSPEAVALADVAEQSWQTVSTTAATFTVDTEAVVRADRSRLRQLLENLINNAVEHAGPDVAVRVGDLEDGFFVEDDGPGIPADRREAVFEHGHSTAPDGNGFGLTIVEQIAEAHDWAVRATDGTEGGARIEVTGIELVEA